MAKIKSIGSRKRGDSLDFYLALHDNGTPITGIADDIACQLRSKPNRGGTLLSTPTITEHDTIPGTYLFECSEDTSDWPNVAFFDAEYTYNGKRSSTDTFKIEFEEDVTHVGN